MDLERSARTSAAVAQPLPGLFFDNGPQVPRHLGRRPPPHGQHIPASLGGGQASRAVVQTGLDSRLLPWGLPMLVWGIPLLGPGSDLG